MLSDLNEQGRAKRCVGLVRFPALPFLQDQKKVWLKTRRKPELGVCSTDTSSHSLIVSLIDASTQLHLNVLNQHYEGNPKHNKATAMSFAPPTPARAPRVRTHAHLSWGSRRCLVVFDVVLRVTTRRPAESLPTADDDQDEDGPDPLDGVTPRTPRSLSKKKMIGLRAISNISNIQSCPQVLEKVFWSLGLGTIALPQKHGIKMVTRALLTVPLRGIQEFILCGACYRIYAFASARIL